MTDSSPSSFEWLKQRLDEMFRSYAQPQDRRIGCGNLRHEYSDWSNTPEATMNVAIIYETPGGSTAQINVTYHRNSDEFSYIDHSRDAQVVTRNPQQVLQMIQEHVREIPVKRLKQLHRQIDTWLGEGKSRSHVFAELNRLLQAEFLGGRINATELKQAIQYAVSHYAGPQSPGS